MTNSRTVFVSGHFNILHPGHVRLLGFAKGLGDKLIVGVYSDRIGGDSVHVPEQLRLKGIQSNNWVSEAFLIDESVTQILNRVRPDIVVKGKEFEGEFNQELETVQQYGGQLLFSSGEAAFSTLDLIQKNLSDIGNTQLDFPKSFSLRRGFTRKSLIEITERFSDLNVCVVGDLIVDEYITCDPLGMSQEDPSIVVTPIDTQRFIGGAGIVAAHAAGLGAKVSLVSVTGNDLIRDFAASTLLNYSVNAQLMIDESRPTTLKQRFRSQNNTLLRVSHLTQSSIGKSLQESMLKKILNVMPDLDILMFSDFNYGCLPQSLVDKIIAHCQERKIIMVADSQCSSQIGDISRFKGMHLLTPTEHEVRVSLRNQEDGLVFIAEQLRQKARAKNIILKLSSEGVLLHMEDSNGQLLTDRLPALRSSPLDVAGAGDAMLATASLALASEGTSWQAAALGSIAAALQVSRLGNQPMDRKEVIKALYPRGNTLTVPTVQKYSETYKGL